jgi:hypothetical protein
MDSALDWNTVVRPQEEVGVFGPLRPADPSIYASIWRVVVAAMNDGPQGDAVGARLGLDQPPEEVGQRIIAQLRNVFWRNIEDRHVTAS